MNLLILQIIMTIYTLQKKLNWNKNVRDSGLYEFDLITKNIILLKMI
jgi:hypothetical protein